MENRLKAKLVNVILRGYCNLNGIPFLNNANINTSHLKVKCFHLNMVGTPAVQEVVDESKPGSFTCCVLSLKKLRILSPETLCNFARSKFSQKYVVVDIVERLAKSHENGVNILTASRGVVGGIEP